jgi:hypothetical protein
MGSGIVMLVGTQETLSETLDINSLTPVSHYKWQSATLYPILYYEWQSETLDINSNLTLQMTVWNIGC